MPIAPQRQMPLLAVPDMDTPGTLMLPLAGVLLWKVSVEPEPVADVNAPPDPNDPESVGAHDTQLPPLHTSPAPQLTPLVPREHPRGSVRGVEPQEPLTQRRS